MLVCRQQDYHDSNIASLLLPESWKSIVVLLFVKHMSNMIYDTHFHKPASHELLWPWITLMYSFLNAFDSPSNAGVAVIQKLGPLMDRQSTLLPNSCFQWRRSDSFQRFRDLSINVYSLSTMCLYIKCLF